MTVGKVKVKKRVFRGEWDKLMVLPQFCLWSEFPFRAKPIDGELRSFGKGLYARIWKMAPDLIGRSNKALFVGPLYWAVDDIAARVVDDRLSLSALGGNRKSWRQREAPPEMLWLPGIKSATCGELYKGAKRAKSGIAESATYGSDGQFKHKNVRALGLEYFFCDRGLNEFEMPFAIRVNHPVKEFLRRSKRKS